MANPIKQVLTTALSPLRVAFTTVRRLPGGLALTIVLITALLITYLQSTERKLEPIKDLEKVWPVDAIVAQHQVIQPRLKLYGQVLAGRESGIRAQVSGNVMSVNDKFREGEWVNKDDTLVEIDPFDYETALSEAIAQRAQAKSQLELLTREHTRAQELFRKKDVSQQFLDTAYLTLEQQKFIVVQRELRVKRAQRDLDHTQIKAPYDGVVAEIAVQEGSRVTPNEKVTTLIDMKRLEVRFSLSKSQYGRILEQDSTLVGRQINVEWHVGEKILSYQGRVDRVSPQISATTGGIELYGELEDMTAQTNLRPGAFVHIAIADRLYRNVVSIPEQALHSENSIYVINEDRLASKKVNILGYDGDHALIQGILKGDIPDGSIIVTTQILEAGSGIKVAVKNLIQARVKTLSSANNKM